MIKGASGKGTRGVTNTAIFSGRHVFVESSGERFTARINTIMTGRAIVHDVGMIDECTSETIRVMARTTVFCSDNLMCCRIRCRYGVNTSAGIVTGVTPLYRCVKQAVVENTTETESHDAMAHAAIDVGDRMAGRLTRR